MTFTAWLSTQYHRSDLVGELAQQVRRAEDWPTLGEDLIVFRVYLARDAATFAAHRALELAFYEWYSCKSLPKVNVPVFLSSLMKSS